MQIRGIDLSGLLASVEEWLYLDPSSPSGVAWAKSRGPRKRGSPALYYLRPDGYYRGTLCSHSMLAHRAVFALVHGYLPEEVDHIDGNRQNNSPDNLREVTRSENSQNRRAAKGYYFDTTSGKWRVQLKVQGTVHRVGRFTTEAEARAAYLNAKETLHPTAPNHGD